MKLEVVVFLSQTSIAPNVFTATWVRGSTSISSRVTRFGAYLHASRLVVLDALRHRNHIGQARICTRTLSRRVRYRGSARRSRRSVCRRSEVFHREVGERPQSGPDPARLHYASYATFQRSGRQRVVIAGSHRTIARTSGHGSYDIHLIKRASRRAGAAHPS